MSVWSRIAQALGLTPQNEPHEVPRHEFHERNEEPPESQYWDETLRHSVWDNIRSEIPDEQERQFADLFQAGWVSMAESPDERQAAREDFFDLLRQDAIPIDVFPWAEWREWYENT